MIQVVATKSLNRPGMVWKRRVQPNFKRHVPQVFKAILPILIACSTWSIAAPLSAQTVHCIPPLLPLLPGDRSVQIEYRAELSEEYNQYFTDAQSYLNCLQHAQRATRDDIHTAIEDYNALLDIPREP